MKHKIKEFIGGLAIACCVFSANSALAQSLPLAVETFSISAPGPEDIIDAMAKQSPKIPGTNDIVLGWTVFKWNYVNVVATETQQGCSVGNVSITGNLTTYHPKLINARTSAWNIKFEQFAQDIRQHENKHAQIYTRHWNNLQSEMSSLSNKTYTAKCNEVQISVQQRLADWENLVSQEHKVLDQAEGHVNEQSLRQAFGI